jgi:CheY-like chemotaxis protein
MPVQTKTIADVLIVEDELVSANALSDVLYDLGYKVLQIVDSSDSAIASVHRHIPDVVLMDIKLRMGLRQLARSRSYLLFRSSI